MSETSVADPAATVRKGLGSGDRLVPGTMSEAEFDAFAALDALVARCEQLERERDDLLKDLRQIADPSYIGSYDDATVIRIYREWAENAVARASA